MADALQTVTLSLISHTNAGKTTLARTLLKRDVGEVRDAAHVTLFNEAHTLISTGDARLVLWDTPGFGDSARLFKRLQRVDRPMAWFFSQMWDRITDRPLWCAQQALKNVREEADVVLYLVNASESLVGGAFVEHEMEILGWIGKPVVVLLNQTGAPRPADEEAAELHLWREHLENFDIVRELLNLDAFTRCWVQEGALMEKLVGVLPGEKRAPFAQLKTAWGKRNEAIFTSSMRVLANQLTANALDGVLVKPETLVQKLGFNRGELEAEWSSARQKLSESLAARAGQSMNELISLHGLEGHEDGEEVLMAARHDFASPRKVEMELWGAITSVATGALAGVIVDLHTGGLTLGAGALLGGLGGLSTYALIKTYSLTKGDDNKLHWSREHFREQVKLALLAYLAVAHFGRGRGAWKRDSRPEFWNEAVTAAVESVKDRIDGAWKKASKSEPTVSVVHENLEAILTETMRGVLAKLYPDQAAQ